MVGDFEAGLTPRMTYGAYAQLEGARYSHLKRFKWSAAHARQDILHPKDPTPALNLGHAVHAAVLEPKLFMDEFVAAPRCDKRTKGGKATWQEFQLENASKEIITDLEFETCIRFSNACWEHPTAKKILSGPGQNEVVARWMQGGTAAKARYDRITSLEPWSIVADLKTTTDAREWSFSADIATYGYHNQAAWYLDGLDAISPHPRKWVFIVLEKSPPWAIQCYMLDDIAIEQGRDENRVYLEAMKKCLKTGKWPSYTPDVKSISIPPYALQVMD